MGYRPATLKTRALLVALLFINERDQQARFRCPTAKMAVRRFATPNANQYSIPAL
jgi:hypothetical protein